MTALQRTYKKLKMDLDLEAEDNNGVISRKALMDIISVNIGYDLKRTVPHVIKQLEAGFILVPLNQHSYKYQPNGYAKQLEKEAQ
jgi:hypothetical protein